MKMHGETIKITPSSFTHDFIYLFIYFIICHKFREYADLITVRFLISFVLTSHH